MHDSSRATLNEVDYHQVEEKSGQIGVLKLNNHQVDYLQLDDCQLDYHRRDYHTVDYHQQKTLLSGHLWLNCGKMICDKLLQQVLDLLSGVGIPAHFYLLWFVNLWLAFFFIFIIGGGKAVLLSSSNKILNRGILNLVSGLIEGPSWRQIWIRSFTLRFKEKQF